MISPFGVPVNIVSIPEGEDFIVVRPLDGSLWRAKPDFLTKFNDWDARETGASHLWMKGKQEKMNAESSEYEPTKGQWEEAHKKLGEAIADSERELFSKPENTPSEAGANTTSEELWGATTAAPENAASNTWGEFAARLNGLPLDQREAWFHQYAQTAAQAQRCYIQDHHGRIRWLDGRLNEAEKLNDRLIKIIGDTLPLAGVDGEKEQLEKSVVELREWIEKYSMAMPEETWFSHNIDGPEEAEILQFIELMTDWYMVVMKASVEVDYEPTLVYNMRFQFNLETQEFTKIADELNVWHTCSKCFGPIRYNDAPTGGWWSHAEHPHDDHDAEL